MDDIQVNADDLAKRIQRELLQNEPSLFGRLACEMSKMSTASMSTYEQMRTFQEFGVFDLRSDGRLPRGQCCASTDRMFVVVNPDDREAIEEALRDAQRKRFRKEAPGNSFGRSPRE